MLANTSPDASLDKETLLRIQVVAMVHWLQGRGRTRAQAVKEVCREPVPQPGGVQRGLKPRTVYRWLQLHSSSGRH